VAFSNGNKAFSLPADVRFALTDLPVTSEKEEILSGEASGLADTDPQVCIQRKEWIVVATACCRRHTHLPATILVSGCSSLAEA